MALATAIGALCEDEPRRRHMGQAALRVAAGMTIDATLAAFEMQLSALAGCGA